MDSNLQLFELFQYALEAQQRGVECTMQVLSGIIEGLDFGSKGSKVYCVDLLPNRLLAS